MEIQLQLAQRKVEETLEQKEQLLEEFKQLEELERELRGQQNGVYLSRR